MVLIQIQRFGPNCTRGGGGGGGVNSSGWGSRLSTPRVGGILIAFFRSGQSHPRVLQSKGIYNRRAGTVIRFIHTHAARKNAQQVGMAGAVAAARQKHDVPVQGPQQIFVHPRIKLSGQSSTTICMSCTTAFPQQQQYVIANTQGNIHPLPRSVKIPPSYQL